MKVLVRLLAAVAILLVILAGISFALPDRTHVERRIEIAAAPAKVFPLINDYRQSVKWSPWLARDPQTTITYSGADKGQGARMSWHSENPEVGVGSQEIIESEQDRLVRVSLAFEGHGTATASFELTPRGDGTLLVWGFDMELGVNPIMRYMGLMFERLLGPDYELGLANIKRIAETDQ